MSLILLDLIFLPSAFVFHPHPAVPADRPAVKVCYPKASPPLSIRRALQTPLALFSIITQLTNHLFIKSTTTSRIIHPHSECNLPSNPATMSSSYTPGHIFNYLNVIPRDEASYEDTFDPNDLSQYTEAKFFDFDMGQPVDDIASKKDTNMRGAEPAIASIDLGLKGGAMDFIGMAFTCSFFPFPFHQRKTPSGSSHGNPAQRTPTSREGHIITPASPTFQLHLYPSCFLGFEAWRLSVD